MNKKIFDIIILGYKNTYIFYILSTKDVFPDEHLLIQGGGKSLVVGGFIRLTIGCLWSTLLNAFQEVYQLPVVFAEEGSACIGVALAVRDLHLARRKRTR